MIDRLVITQVLEGLRREAAVALVGPRQVGKTTLARQFVESQNSIYLDLEADRDLQKLKDPYQFLSLHDNKLVIIDEVHRAPELFRELRGLIDEGRRSGKGTGRYLLLGSASIDLMKQSESLAGRIEYVEMAGFQGMERPNTDPLNKLWVRGGFPRSYLAKTDGDSLVWRDSFKRSYLERDIPMFHPGISTESIGRMWQMLAHNQGALFNASQIARSLSISSPTAASYLGFLVGLLLVRRLPPFVVNTGKRLTKSPKTYIRDSGLVHALLNIETIDDLLGHPVAGNSWEGFVIENILSVAPRRTEASFYRTAIGNEIDLVLNMGGKGLWAIEIKLGHAPKLSQAFYHAIEDIQPDKTFIVYSGEERYPKGPGIEVISLIELMRMLQELN